MKYKQNPILKAAILISPIIPTTYLTMMKSQDQNVFKVA